MTPAAISQAIVAQAGAGSWARGHVAPVAIALVVGLAASASAVFVRYHDRHLCGSRQSRLRAATLVVATAVVSTVLGVIIPLVAPWMVAAAGPFALDVGLLIRPEDAGGSAANWRRALTLGLNQMVTRLETQLIDDRTAWINYRVDPNWSPAQIEARATSLYDSMAPRIVGNRDKRARAKSARRQITKHVRRAVDHHYYREDEQHRCAARDAYKRLVGYAYDWRYTDLKPVAVAAVAQVAG